MKTIKVRNKKEVRDEKVAQVVLVALFALCVDTSFAFGTYNHNVTIQNQPMYDYADKAVQAFERDRKRQYEQNMLDQQLRTQQMMQYQNQMFQMQQQQQLLDKQEHLQKLASDPEYALRDKLNQKENAILRVANENSKKASTFNEKNKILDERFELLDGELDTFIDDKKVKKVKSVFAKIDALIEKEKALDKSKLLPQEKDEIKNFLSKAVELNTKRQAMIDEVEVAEREELALYDDYRKKMSNLGYMFEKNKTEIEKYQHKIEYDNKAYEAYLNIREKQNELFINLLREEEVYFLKRQKLYDKKNKFVAEAIEFQEQIIKHKSFVKKYERFFKKVEKRLGV